MAKEFTIFELKRFDGINFTMSPVELQDYIDFPVKRVYWISNTTGPTSSHCHKIEEEMFIMAKGSCVAVIDRGNGLEEIPMVAPTTAVYIPAYDWHHFKDFSPDAVLLALSSTNYTPDRSDYIDSYDEFLVARKNHHAGL